MGNSAKDTDERSTFVSVIAWVFIVLSGFGTLVSLMQNIMVSLLFSGPEIQSAISKSGATADMPAIAAFMFSHFRLFVFLIFILIVFTLIASIGVLKRKNWARIIFIGILGLSILSMAGSIAVQYFFFSGPSGFGAENIPADMKTMMRIMQIFFVVLYSAIAIVLAWIIKKLLSPKIAREFQER